MEKENLIEDVAVNASLQLKVNIVYHKHGDAHICKACPFMLSTVASSEEKTCVIYGGLGTFTWDNVLLGYSRRVECINAENNLIKLRNTLS